MASATSPAVRQRTSTWSSGSRRWSRRTTASSSSRTIRSGPSKGPQLDERRQPPELGAAERDDDVAGARLDARRDTNGRLAERHVDDQPAAVERVALQLQVEDARVPV